MSRDLRSHLIWGGVRRAIYALGASLITVWVGRRFGIYQSGPLYWAAALAAVTWIFMVLMWLRSYRFICRVCTNPDEPMGLLEYVRGRGVHTWHPGGGP